MSRAATRARSPATSRVTRSSASNRTRDTAIKKEESAEPTVKEEDEPPQQASRAPSRKRISSTAHSDRKRVKKEEQTQGDTEQVDASTPPRRKSPSAPKKSTPSSLIDKKLKSYAQFAKTSPFPDFAHPTPQECKLAHRILAALHGPRHRPKEVIASSDRAGCGDSPSVLDALVRTILSQNTSDTNSTRAKKSMDKVYGSSSKWDAIASGGQPKLQDAIKCGGLSAVKSKVILSILDQVYNKYGVYSLDHLHSASSEDAMNEMLSFQGVGPKTASCVLLFCLQRESFAVDTHVWRITGLLGWRPKSASRDETHAHLDIMIPDEDKYGLHILLVTHGKRCEECRAGGKTASKCELRKAFRHGKIQEEAGKDEEDVEEEALELVKNGTHEDSKD